MELRDALLESNPWWNSKGFFDVKIKPRSAFAEIEKFMEKKQVIGIYGLRRTGKSFLLFHLIKRLLEKKDAASITYFSFDAFRQTDLSEVIKEAESITGKKQKFVFLDEVQKLDGWTDQVKREYDLKQIKIVVTGSESLFIKKTSKESLAGRIFEFELQPLSFKEYVSFKELKTIGSHESRDALEHYLLTGGFPELVEEKDSLFINKYLKEGIIDKAVFQEIPQRFGVEDPSLLQRILNIIIDNPGMIIDKNSLSKTLGVFRTTISKYLFYLESCFLIKSLYNYSRNATTSEKKLKKYYPGFACLGLGNKNDPVYFSKVVETVCVLHSKTKFFWRTPQKDEVDIILTNPLQPIEVKYREQPDSGGIPRFQHVFSTENALVITKNTEKTQEKIKYIPLAKWLMQDTPA